MEYEEYKEILNAAMIDYVNSGGSLYYMGTVKKEYIFSYENGHISYEDKKRLSDKAVQAMIKKQKLPSGIRLEKCIWHGKD